MVEYPSRHVLGSSRVVFDDEGADAVDIRERTVRRNQFEVHAAAHGSSNCSASSRVLLRPAAISSRPRRIAAIIRNSSEMSSSEASSGSLRNASITACLSVISDSSHSRLSRRRSNFPAAPMFYLIRTPATWPPYLDYCMETLTRSIREAYYRNELSQNRSCLTLTPYSAKLDVCEPIGRNYSAVRSSSEHGQSNTIVSRGGRRTGVRHAL